MYWELWCGGCIVFWGVFVGGFVWFWLGFGVWGGGGGVGVEREWRGTKLQSSASLDKTLLSPENLCTLVL